MNFWARRGIGSTALAGDHDHRAIPIWKATGSVRFYLG